MDKKGQEDMLNWVFILVSGAIILGFFAIFIVKYIDLQEKKESIEISRIFFETLKVLQQSSTTDSGYYIGADDPNGFKTGIETSIGYSCENDKASIIVNEESLSSLDVSEVVLYLPNEMRIKSLDTWIFPWNFPYFVDNFVFISDDERKFLIIFDEDNREFATSLDIPYIFDVELVEKGQENIDLESNTKLVYITKFKPTDVGSYTHINKETKEVTFSDESGIKTEKYLGEAMLYGAIFSENYNTYECNFKRATKILDETSKVYIEKARVIGNLDRKPECQYGLIQLSIDRFRKGEYELVSQIEEQNNLGQGCYSVY